MTLRQRLDALHRHTDSAAFWADASAILRDHDADLCAGLDDLDPTPGTWTPPMAATEVPPIGIPDLESQLASAVSMTTTEFREAATNYFADILLDRMLDAATAVAGKESK